MSADNWAVCPNCKDRNGAEFVKQQKRVADSYGQVTAEEYLALLKEAGDAPKELEPTLREDYEIGINEDGEFSVNYRSGCQVCSLTFEYKHTEPVPLPPLSAPLSPQHQRRRGKRSA